MGTLLSYVSVQSAEEKCSEHWTLINTIFKILIMNSYK